MGEYTKKAKGKLKQAVGSITGDKSLKREGEADERAGQVEGAIADVKHAAKTVVKDAKSVAKEVTR
jgi:uncharacterized protein YjbJ (UPF0337 family)